MTSKAKRRLAARAGTPQRPRRPVRPARRNSGWVFWTVVGGIVLIGLVVGVVVAAGGGDDTSENREIAQHVSVHGAALPDLENPADDPAVGEDAPELIGVDFEKQQVSTGSAQPSLLVFLAHWCPHCQAEVPRIVSLAEAGGLEGIDVTAVATGTNPDATNYPPSTWLRRERWPFPVLVDTADARAALAYGLPSYPMLVFVDADGRVAARVTGEIAEEELAAMAAALVAGEPVPIPGAGPASER